MKDNIEYIKNIYEKNAKILDNDEVNKFCKNKIKKRNSNFYMMKFSMVFIMIIISSFGIVYATYNVYTNYKKANFFPSFISSTSEIDSNKIWIASFQLIWNDLMDDIVKGPIQFESYDSILANDLNKQSFKDDQLSDEDYYKTYGLINEKTKQEIEENIEKKFNTTSKILNKINWNDTTPGYILYCMLKKDFSYLYPFDKIKSDSFAGSQINVEYFGINQTSSRDASKNIEVLFYNSKEDFAVKLKTKEGEEVFIYRNNDLNHSFSNIYNEIIEKEKQYSGESEFLLNDIIQIPYIKISEDINYDELCGKAIKNTDYVILQAIQTIDFELDNEGGHVESEALIELRKSFVEKTDREFKFNDKFVLFLKEENKEKPYLALKIDNTDFLIEE